MLTSLMEMPVTKLWSHDNIYNIIQVPVGDVMDRDMTSSSLFQNTFNLRRPRVANFTDIIKMITIFIKTVFKDSKKLKELEIMYQNAIYICIS